MSSSSNEKLMEMAVARKAKIENELAMVEGELARLLSPAEEKTMKEYCVSITGTYSYQIIVEANSDEEAIKKGEDAIFSDSEFPDGRDVQYQFERLWVDCDEED